MPTDASLHALREANPRNRRGFDESIERYDALRSRITATPIAPPRRRPPVVRRRRLIGLSAAAAATLVVAGVVVGLTLTAASPPSAYAALKKALAATAAAASGTMTATVVHGGSSYTLDTTQWNGNALAMTGGQRSQLGPNQQLLLLDGGVYVQQGDGTWLHYENAADIGPKLGPMVQLAQDNVAGNTADQILVLATGLQQTTEPGGSSVYTGTIPNSSADPGVAATDDAIIRMITNLRSGNEPGAPGGSHGDLQLQMTVGNDGLVRQISLSFQQQDSGAPGGDGSYTWSVTYSQLGSAPPITAPASSTPVESGAGPSPATTATITTTAGP
jgi:hypothetical protein